MSLLKALLAFDSKGINIIHYLSEDFNKNPELISGMLSALNSFNNELFNSDFDYFKTKSNLSIIHSKFYVKYILKRKHMSFSPDFPIREVFVKGSLFNSKLKDGYVLGSSLILTDESPKFNIYHLNDLFDDMGLEKKIINFYDLNNLNKPAYYLIYTPELSFEVSNNHDYDEVIHTCIIYNSINNFNKEVRDLLDNFNCILKQNIQLIGPALLWGETIMVNKFVEKKIKELSDKFNETNKIMELKFKMAKQTELGKEMRSKIKELIDIIKSSK